MKSASLNPKAGVATVLIVAGLAVVGLLGWALKPVISNAAGGLSHRPADKYDAAVAKTGAAEKKVTIAEDNVLTGAHREFVKAGVALELAPKGPEVDYARRFVANGNGLLNQINPLAAADTSLDRQLVMDLLSRNEARATAAEQRQAQAEGANSKLSVELALKQRELDEQRGARLKAEAGLREGFERENALANEYRHEVFVRRIAIGAVVLLVVACLYLRMGLGSVGAALYRLPSIIGPEAAQKVISTLDTETDRLHQLLVSAGRSKIKDAEAAAAKVLGITQPPA
jgi:hypothetical protein